MKLLMIPGFAAVACSMPQPPFQYVVIFLGRSRFGAEIHTPDRTQSRRLLLLAV